MKAARFSEYGGSEVLRVEEIAEPSPGKNQVLVKVKAGSINPFDIKLVAGMFKDMIPLRLPVTVGGDFAGMVVKSGEEVYGTAAVVGGGSGSLAEMAVVNVGNMAGKPKNISFVEAAALPLVGSSAVQAVEEQIKLKAGQKILIHGGAGGIGHVAIQVAKVLGAEVATTVSGEDREFVQGLGADRVVDYKTEDFGQVVKDYDAVFDTVGGEVATRPAQSQEAGGGPHLLLGAFPQSPGTERAAAKQ